MQTVLARWGPGALAYSHHDDVLAPSSSSQKGKNGQAYATEHEVLYIQHLEAQCKELPLTQATTQLWYRPKAVEEEVQVQGPAPKSLSTLQPPTFPAASPTLYCLSQLQIPVSREKRVG